MSLEHLEPFAKTHAIQNVVFAIEWAGAMSPTELVELRQGVNVLADDFPGPVQEQRTMTVNLPIGGNVGGVVQPSEEFGGFIFRTALKDGVLPRTINVTRESCVITIPDYAGWKSVKADADKYLGILIPQITRHKGISGIGLQYTDVFSWKADPSALKMRAVFKEPSPFLPPHIYDLSSFWHAHHGYFIDGDDPVTHRRLDNINISRTEHAGLHVVNALTSHKVQLENLIWQNVDSIFELFEVLHDANKSIVSAVFSDEVLKKINLKKET